MRRARPSRGRAWLRHRPDDPRIRPSAAQGLRPHAAARIGAAASRSASAISRGGRPTAAARRGPCAGPRPPCRPLRRAPRAAARALSRRGAERASSSGSIQAARSHESCMTRLALVAMIASSARSSRPPPSVPVRGDESRRTSRGRSPRRRSRGATAGDSRGCIGADADGRTRPPKRRRLRAIAPRMTDLVRDTPRPRARRASLARGGDEARSSSARRVQADSSSRPSSRANLRSPPPRARPCNPAGAGRCSTARRDACSSRRREARCRRTSVVEVRPDAVIALHVMSRSVEMDDERGLRRRLHRPVAREHVDPCSSFSTVSPAV